MSKGGVIVLVGVGAAVILIGGVALASTSKPVTRPLTAPPPPPPPVSSLGSFIVNEGGNLYDEANKNPIFNTYTGGSSFKTYVKDYAINPYLPLAKAGYKGVKKIFGSIF